jgi:predicted NACHT family NTPase
VTKAEDIRRLLDNCEGAFNNTFAPIGKQIEHFSSWLKEAPIRHDTLMRSEEFRTYNGLMEVCRANPHLLRKGHIIATLSYDGTLLDKSDSPLLITGPPGYGKTSFCKWSALNDGERFVKNESNVMPIYIALYRLSESMPGTFEDGLAPQERFPMVWSKPGTLREGMRIRLYLDGLDELSPDRQAHILSIVRDAAKKYTQLHVVVTARDQVIGPELRWLVRIHIAGLNDEEIHDLVSQLLDRDDVLVGKFFDQLKKLPSLKELMRAPLVTTLVVSVFVGMGSLPQSRTELYRIFVDLMCGGWDAAKGFKRHASFSPTIKMSVLLRLARRLHESGNREASSFVMRETINEVIDLDIGIWEALSSDIVQDGLLSRDGDSFSFAHLSFQEYLCARDLADPTSKDAFEGVRRYLEGDDWWREIAIFSVSMSSRPAQIREIARQFAPKGSERWASIEQAIAESFPEHKR